MHIDTILEVDRLVVTVLAEDHAGPGTRCWAQNGLSLLLNVTVGSHTKTILFDTGWSPEPILHNMRLLDISPESIEMVALSHCHRDHTGGLVRILEEVKRQDVPVLAHPAVFRSHVLDGGVPDGNLWLMKELGMIGENTLQNIVRYGGYPTLLSEPALLMPGVVWSGEIPRECSFEASVTIPVRTIAEGHLVEDQMADDSALIVVVRDKGLVVLSGCCHAGIMNTIAHAIRITGVDRICAVVGGLHLMDATDERIDQTATALLNVGVERLYTGHCTGFRGEIAMHSTFKNAFEGLFCGKVIDSLSM